MSAQDNLSKPQMEKVNLPGYGETRYLSRTANGGGVSSTLVHPYTQLYTMGGDAKDEHGNPVFWEPYHTPPKVDNLFAHGHSPADVAAHLGTVALESLHKFGELPDTSGERLSLSESSAPLVNRINKKLKRPAVSVDEGNHMTPEDASQEVKGAKSWFDTMSSPTNTQVNKHHSHIDPNFVKVGSGLVRSVLAPKKNLSKRQFDNQPELPF